MICSIIQYYGNLAEPFFRRVQIHDKGPVVGLASGHIAGLPVQHDAAVYGLALVAEWRLYRQPATGDGAVMYIYSF